MKKCITLDGKNEITRLSRWITVRTNYNVSKRNSLYDFSTDENGNRPYEDNYNPENGTYLDYFHFGGRTYAIEQFVGLGSNACPGKPYQFEDTDGTLTTVSAVDFDGSLFDPLYLESDEYCERVRVYEVKNLKYR